MARLHGFEIGLDLGNLGGVGIEGLAMVRDDGAVGLEGLAMVRDDGAVGLELGDACFFEGLEAGDVFVLNAQLLLVLFEAF